ncbi:MAG: hypothetical protein Q8L87_03895 [Anaerolineales bacterium]|nr:hypothetical protein [Anaerolineales bacterium]
MTSQVFAITRRGIISLLIALASSFALMTHFFNADSYSAVDQFFLFAIPFISLVVCIYPLLPRLEEFFIYASVPVRLSLSVLAMFAALIVLLPVINITSFGFYPAFLSLFSVFLALTLPAVPFLQKSIEAGASSHLLARWTFSTIAAFLLIGFLDDFYNSFFEIVCLTLLLQVILSVAGDLVLEGIGRLFRRGVFDTVIIFLLYLLLILFAAVTFSSNQAFPLFPAEHFTLRPDLQPAFLIPSLLFLPWQIWLDFQIKTRGIHAAMKDTKFYSFIERNLPGIALASVFLGIYLLNAAVINHPRFDVDDIYFDADGLNYRLRLTTDTWRDYYWRSVHPFMILLLKPPVDLLSFFLKGDKLFGVYLFVSGAGAACVYLAWAFIREVTKNSIYASLIAALLGLSTSHLFFGSFIESYIFLAASLLLFHVLLIKDRPFPALVMAGLATIGITHSNFAQNVIAFFSVKFNIKQTIRFVATVLVFLVLLTLLNNLLYPEAHPFFFVPSTLQAEGQNLFPLNMLRIQALTRAFLFHNVVAPTPILYADDIPFVQFRFFKPEINSLSKYETPLQNFAAWIWMGLLVLAVLTYFINFKKNNHKPISLALLACILMNLGLHLRYGKELFLYSPNWTYALILLAGLGWQGIAKHKWFQTVLLLFLIFLAINNGLLLRGIIEILAPQI